MRPLCPTSGQICTRVFPGTADPAVSKEEIAARADTAYLPKKELTTTKSPAHPVGCGHSCPGRRALLSAGVMSRKQQLCQLRNVLGQHILHLHWEALLV